MTTGTPPPTPSARPPRSRLRRFLPLGLAAWLVLEIWLLSVVAGAAGGLTVFLLLLAGVVLGGIVIKRAGRRAFKSLNEQLRAAQLGAVPDTSGRSEGNGLTMLGGLLLMLPGLVSDAVGLVLLLPPVRKTVAARSERAMERRLRESGPGTFENAYQQARMHRPDGKVVPGEVIRDDTPPPQDEGPRPPIAS
ncbi:phage T7 F exclusion suppressor FxsA [Streptomyces sp. YIM 130001]|uniref:FxsA family membrane protein n=1 Tax=Streptomyces sp. YIM 130001 TaxID=2259644 RepID=UPI000E655CE5|nr:FxsA family membrane protein [Streptomyces sp. YIM 130001]RII19386.1 phage T7 F exclusion suppressor FxsA [Streptomyces sp. YIM 130001]